MSAFEIKAKARNLSVPYPIPVMKTIKSPTLFFGESCNLNTPEIGRSRMNTSDTNAHAANGIEIFMPMAARDVAELAIQDCPARGVAPIKLASVKAV